MNTSAKTNTPLITTWALGAALAFALPMMAPAMAASGGKIDTLERGTYTCEMPGDAAIGRGVRMPEEGFVITSASGYKATNGKGTYLRTGNIVTMTSGPRNGTTYVMKNARYLRKLGPDGVPTGLRCIK